MLNCPRLDLRELPITGYRLPVTRYPIPECFFGVLTFNNPAIR